MKPFTLSKDSWHYKLTGFMFNLYYPQTICGYFWKLLASLVLLSGGLVGVTVILYIFANMALLLPIALLVSLINGVWLVTGMEFIFFAVFLAAAGGTLSHFFLYEINEFCDRIDAKEKKEKPPGFIILAYRSWKEKTCVRIDFQ